MRDGLRWERVALWGRAEPWKEAAQSEKWWWRAGTWSKKDGADVRAAFRVPSDQKLLYFSLLRRCRQKYLMIYFPKACRNPRSRPGVGGVEWFILAAVLCNPDPVWTGLNWGTCPVQACSQTLYDTICECADERHSMYSRASDVHTVLSTTVCLVFGSAVGPRWALIGARFKKGAWWFQTLWNNTACSPHEPIRGNLMMSGSPNQLSSSVSSFGQQRHVAADY